MGKRTLPWIRDYKDEQLKSDQPGKVEIPGHDGAHRCRKKKTLKRCPQGRGIRFQFGFMQQEDQKEADY